MVRRLHLAVALDGCGWHPGAWREDGAGPHRLLEADRWVGLVREAEAGLLDLVTFEDAMTLPSTNAARGRLDATLLAARVAPATSHVGLVPTVVATHTEPFHASTSLATVDHVSRGRAGVQLQVSADPREARLFGRRRELERSSPDVGLSAALLGGLYDEAADHAEVQRRLWDSWEDDAEIRDVATGRFVDRERLHHVDFEGAWFSVTGPSITPRPPQGQLPVLVTVRDEGSRRLAERQADVAVTALGAERPDTAVVLADVRVVLAPTGRRARKRLADLDRLAGEDTPESDDLVVGTPADLARWLLEDRGVDGFRLHPAGLPHDLVAITREVVPVLQRHGAFRTAYAETQLRERLGLTRPASRYAREGVPA